MIARSPSATLRLVAAILLVGALVAPAPARTPQPDPYAGWARVLDRFVNDRGEVDFHRLAGDRADLETFLEYVARVSRFFRAA